MVLDFLNSVKSYKNQKYDTLKKEAQDTGVPFSDPLFPADDSSLFLKGNHGQLPGRVEWRRPKELCENPKLFVGGASSCDVVQGMLGNCWFVAACSALAQEKELWNKVIPDYKDQEWSDENPDNYCGIFHFRFWQFGEWIDVVIDDRLPTINGELVYLRSREKTEFWGPLLEKAYTKLAGSYEALEGGNLSDALVDFTGGISENIELQKGGYSDDEVKRKELFKIMLKEIEQHSLMCCAVAATDQQQMEQRTEVGLVKGHAYGITAVKKVYIGNTGLISFFTGREKIYMVRLRNPWGGKEWEGPFSDGSPEWAKISSSERERIGLTFEDDGEFWMPFEDFCRHFTDMSICHMVNTSWFSFSKSWREASFQGQWTTGPKGTATDRAGGCLNHRNTFLRNPQYRFNIDGEEDTILIYLMQKDTRNLLREGGKNLVIGFHIMKVEVNRRYRLHMIMEKAATSDYIRTRGIFLRCTLKRGRYVIIPSTFEPDLVGDFMMRIFTSKESDARELTAETPPRSLWPCISYPSIVTKITVRGASGLEKQDRFGTADPYCIIKCGGENVRSHICKDTLEPVWNVSAIFYRKNVNSPLKVQVWNSNIVMDSYMGKAIFMAPLSTETVIHEADLFGRKNEKGVKKPGKVVVELITTDDLLAY
ncbi:calpain-5-like isoform X1 [Tachypleus tridentatus]|uniref:calpain-5-like isoform X1 n=1 Tax=Tachypleus tridentatus TaxID=6853 RepID=UPI003FD00E9F